MASYMVEDYGCGFVGRILDCGSLWHRKASVRSLPSNNCVKKPTEKASIPQGEKNEPDNPVEGTKLRLTKAEKQISKFTSASPRGSISQRLSDTARSSVATATSSSSSSTNSNLPKSIRIQERQPSGDQSDLVNELNKITNIAPNSGILRASSGNILQLAQISTANQQGNEVSTARNMCSTTATKALDYNVTMGNILRRNSDEVRLQGPMNKLDSEELKSMGNEKYKQGKFEEALALYDQAIAMDSNRAAYHSNKSAALTALGRVLEAVLESREAIRIEPFYQRAHHRLATLYYRLGCAEDALQHLKFLGTTNNFKLITQAKELEECVKRCIEAEELKDWITALKETYNVISIGADSAIQIYALQAKALLSLRRHDEAYAALKRRPSFDMDAYSQVFGQKKSIYIHITEAQVNMAMGRFEDAISAAEKAARLNPSEKDARRMVIRTRCVAIARSKGNRLFKESKFQEACSTYSEGLEYDPYNSVLLCNRAASRSKLGKFEKALEDCTLALSLRPSYSKARLRRAHCNAKMERWEASILDYEVLTQEMLGNEEVVEALFQAQIQHNKKQILSIHTMAKSGQREELERQQH